MPVSVTFLTYGISPVVTKVSVLSNLRISGSELKDKYYRYISFVLWFKTNFNGYFGIPLIFKSKRGFSTAGAGYTNYPV